MKSWQIWQLLMKIVSLSVVMLIEQVLGMPLLSLLLLYWWFGRSANHHFAIGPIVVLSTAIGLLYGGSLSMVYVVLSVWWWLTTQITGAQWLRSILIFGSACGATGILFFTRNPVRWEFATGWIVVSALVWWKLYQGNQGIKHVA